MSRILQFYRDEQIHPEGYTLRGIWNWNDQDLEYRHDYIQWLFPLPNLSREVPNSPVIDEEEMRQFRTDGSLKERMRGSFQRMLAFYGFKTMTNANGTSGVIAAEDFPQKAVNWLTPGNHNYKRISRILRSLRLLGLKEECISFYQALRAVYKTSFPVIGSRAMSYWHTAAGAPKGLSARTIASAPRNGTPGGRAGVPTRPPPAGRSPG